MAGLAKSVVGSTPKGFRKFVRQVMPPVIWRALRDSVEGIPERPPARQSTGEADTLESKLWGGFSKRALTELTALKRHPSTSTKDIADACRVLACWHASRGESQLAYDNALMMRVARPKLAHTDLQILLEADALMSLGAPELAREILGPALEGAPERSAFQLAMANTFASSGGPTTTDDDRQRLHYINLSFDQRGVAPLSKRNDSEPLALTNLTARAEPCKGDLPKVTVLIPAYSSQDTLACTLDSLLAQTWTNLEIIVVDDVSPDGTFDVARQYGAKDPRVIALRQTKNQGAYAARNLGLSRASGKFVTVHDADDWSHPQKIEIQVKHLLETQVAANLTDWVRCLPHLYFRGRARASLAWVHFNHSSLMLERDLLVKLGGWDQVRIAADSELIRRLEHGFVEGRVPRLHAGLPLAFALVAPTSLTQASVTHARTLRHGVRRTYQDASVYWLSKRPQRDVALPTGDGERAFPATGFILPNKTTTQRLDRLFVHDFGYDEAADERLMASLHEELGQGLRVGVFHWHHYETDVARGLPEEIFSLAERGGLYVATPGERLVVKTTICRQPEVFLDELDLPPHLETATLELTVPSAGEAPASREQAAQAQPDETKMSEWQKRIEAKVTAAFGLQPTWLPS